MGPFEVIILFPALLWGAAIGCLLFVSGRGVRDLRGYWLAFTVSILAMLPCHPMVIVTFPLGLWTLVVLLRPGMRAAFEERAARGEAPSDPLLPPGKELPAAPDAVTARRLMESKVAWCARGLRVAGWVDLIAWVGLVIFCIAASAESGLPPTWIALFLSLYGLRFAAGAIVLLGAHHLSHFESRLFAWLGALAAIFPVSPGWIVGLPCGAWAIFLLTRRDVKAEFDRRLSLAEQNSGAWRSWLAGAAMLAAAAASFSFFIVSSTAPSSSMPATATYYPSGSASSPTMGTDYSLGNSSYSSSSTMLSFGGDEIVEIDGALQLNPTLHHQGVSPVHEAVINEALREARTEYLALEAKNTSRAVDDRGYRVITVAPLAADVKNALEDRFWSKVDSAFHSDQERRELRYWLKLDAIAPHQNGLFLEYRRIGALYNWRRNQTAQINDYAFRDEPLPNDLKRIIDADQATLIEPPAPE